MRRVAAIAIVLAVGACRWLTEPNHTVVVNSPAEVTLKVGDEVRVDGVLRVKFAGVPSDSRCPATAECFWAGDALVVLEGGTGLGPCADTLHTLQTQLVACGNYLIQLLELAPYPQSFERIPPGDYAAKLGIRTGAIPSAAPPAPADAAPPTR